MGFIRLMKEGSLNNYLKKSKDTLEEFKSNPGVFTSLNEKSLDWLDYEIYGDVFWIRTIHGKSEDKKECMHIWNKIKRFARKLGCSKIQFTTKRDGKVWERLFKDMKIIQWKLEIKL